MDTGFWRLLKETDIIGRVFRKPFLNDEPKLFSFGAEINLESLVSDGNAVDRYSAGTSLDENSALCKAIFEAIERISLAEFRFRDFVFDSYKNISKSNNAINPHSFCYFSEGQLQRKKFNDFSFSPEDKFYWVSCINLDTDQTVYLPAQQIYCPYKYYNNEKVLSFPITTGASVAETLDEAVYKGLCEVIERDAYITSYLLKLKPREIVYNNIHSSKINKLLEISRKYNLEIKSFILISDLEIPTVLSAIIDSTEKGPALCIGLKTEWNLEKAIIGSVEEAFQVRSWIRISMIKNDWVGDTYTTKNMLKRAYIWKDKSNIKNLDFFIKSGNKTTIFDKDLRRYSQKTPSEKLKLLKDMLNKNKISSHYKEVTSKKFRNMPVKVVKCVVPSLHPMFIDNDYPYLGSSRIKTLKKKYGVRTLNLYPHPFL